MLLHLLYWTLFVTFHQHTRSDLLVTHGHDMEHGNIDNQITNANVLLSNIASILLHVLYLGHPFGFKNGE